MRSPRGLVAACCLVIAALTAPAPAGAQAREAQSFVGKTWISTDPTAAANTLRIFLPDGTLVMGSCTETYRLASWRSTGAQRIEWREDTARIQAEVSLPPSEPIAATTAAAQRNQGRALSARDRSVRLPGLETQPSEPAVTVTGRVFFLERLALPPSAVVRVELRDTSRADAPARTLATQTIAANQGPPFAFSLTTPRSAIDRRASLSVFAEIRDGKRLMFTTDTRHPVPVDGASGMEVRLRFVASGAGDRAPGIVTPVPTTLVLSPRPLRSHPLQFPPVVLERLQIRPLDRAGLLQAR